MKFEKYLKEFKTQGKNCDNESIEESKQLKEESTADDDMKHANMLKNDLEHIIKQIDIKVNKTIPAALSEYNAPGLKDAFLKAIKFGVDTKEKTFNVQLALEIFNRYYTR